MLIQGLSDISAVEVSLWPIFIAGIVVLLLVDLLVFGRQNQTSNTKHALIESGLWISVALLFNLWFAFEYGQILGVEFLTGYLIEKSLSIDNLFIILLVFQSLKIPAHSQHRVLFYGILGAIVLRGFFILLGAHLIQNFNWIFYIFGFILIFTAVNFLREEKTQIKEHWLVVWLHRKLPITSELKGQQFLHRHQGKLFFTPLFIALIIIEFTDLVFAIDSIPAVFAVTQDGFVAFASNILAVLGLRALYFVLAHWVSELKYLKPGLAVILGFIGIKMLIKDFVHLPAWVSLLVISGTLTTAALSSWYVTREKRQS